MATGTVNRPLGNYKTFYTVASLGLTTGSATVSDAWNALPTQSILIAGVGNFATGARPYSSAYGQIVIVKNTATNGYIYLRGLTENVGDFRMYLTGSPEVPSEIWIPTDMVVKSTAPDITNGTYDSTYSSGIQVHGRIATLSAQISGVSVATSATQLGTIPSGYRPAAAVHTVGFCGNSNPVRIYVGTNGVMNIAGPSALSSQTLRFSATWII